MHSWSRVVVLQPPCTHMRQEYRERRWVSNARIPGAGALLQPPQTSVAGTVESPDLASCVAEHVGKGCTTAMRTAEKLLLLLSAPSEEEYFFRAPTAPDCSTCCPQHCAAADVRPLIPLLCPQTPSEQRTRTGCCRPPPLTAGRSAPHPDDCCGHRGTPRPAVGDDGVATPAHRDSREWWRSCFLGCRCLPSARVHPLAERHSAPKECGWKHHTVTHRQTQTGAHDRGRCTHSDTHAYMHPCGWTQLQTHLFAGIHTPHRATRIARKAASIRSRLACKHMYKLTQTLTHTHKRARECTKWEESSAHSNLRMHTGIHTCTCTCMCTYL